MTVNVVLLGVVAVLCSAGVYLLLERSLTRVVLGIVLFSNGINVLLLSSGGPAGRAPLVGRAPIEEMSDPLPQAMILTAIVITMGVVAFLLSLVHRSWTLDRREDVSDDPEDRRIAERPREPDRESDVAPWESPYDSGEDLGRRGSVRVEMAEVDDR